MWPDYFVSVRAHRADALVVLAAVVVCVCKRACVWELETKLTAPSPLPLLFWQCTQGAELHPQLRVEPQDVVLVTGHDPHSDSCA